MNPNQIENILRGVRETLKAPSNWQNANAIYAERCFELGQTFWVADASSKRGSECLQVILIEKHISKCMKILTPEARTE